MKDKKDGTSRSEDFDVLVRVRSAFCDYGSIELGALIIFCLSGYQTRTWGTGHIRVNVITN